MSDIEEGPGHSRRDFLRRAGLIGAAGVFAPAFLAACGSDKKSTGSGATTTAAGGAATGDLASILKIDPNGKNGKGVDFSMASVLALTGSGSFYGKTMTSGIELAVKHIAAAGGPNFKVKYWDHKSGDAAAGKQAMTEIGSGKFPAKLASYADDLGVMLDDTAKFKVFTLDGGGGTSLFAQGKPYFWGTRAITPNDTLPGAFRWWTETNPGKKKVGFTGWDIGEPSNTQIKEDILAKIKAAGLEFNGLYEFVPVGNQDFSAVFPKIKANEPDLLCCGLYGQDPGSFVNQSVTAGLKAFPLGFEFTPDGVNASKGSYDSVGWTFTYDYFDATNPVSPLAKFFVADYKKANGGNLPDFYAANFYENTLVMWEVIRRVLAKGGDINDGDQLDKALQENLTVVSVYGGDANTVGSYTLDPKTHSVSKREMGVFQYKGGKVTSYAFFGIGGEGYRKV
jgi:ABC-type branched-subunit amino acid transport system substrate-binding protein